MVCWCHRVEREDCEEAIIFYLLVKVAVEKWS